MAKRVEGRKKFGSQTKKGGCGVPDTVGDKRGVINVGVIQEAFKDYATLEIWTFCLSKLTQRMVHS